MSRPELPYDHLSDLELFKLTSQGNTASFETLYNRYWPELTNAAYKRLQSRQKAEDIVQEIFISLYNKRATLEFTVSLKAYLNQALKFKVLNEFRAEQVRAAYTKSLFLKDFCKNDFANRLETKELADKIHHLLAQLPEQCRRVYHLSRNENMTNKEIAMELKIAVSTVEKHIGKALKMLRERLRTDALPY